MLSRGAGVNWLVISVMAYIVGQLVLGVWVSRRVRSESDYLVAGRSLGPWLSVFTVFATWFGAETCIGAAGRAYEGGLSATKSDPFGYAIALFAFALLVAVPLWKRGIYTLADLYRSRYGAGIERLTAIVMIPTSVMWAAAQIRALGQVMGASTELGVFATITIAAIVVIAYTAFGGMLADAVTDLLQGIVLIVGILLLAVVAWYAGDFSLLAQQAPERLDVIAPGSSLMANAEAFSVPILGSLVAQELASRVLAMRSHSLARGATFTAGALYLLVGLMPLFLGLVAYTALGSGLDSEQILTRYAQHHLGTVPYIVFVGALVSAILSTVAGALFVAGSLAAHNLVLPLKPDTPEAMKLRLNRICVILFGLGAYVMALTSESIYGLVEEASSFGTSGLLIVLVFSLWLPRIGGRASAYAAILSGTGSYVLGAHVLNVSYPFLTSIGIALAAYLLAIPWSRPPLAATSG